MFIRQLHYLVALAREQHFGRAAEQCHVSQPTLSAGLQHLEEELGVAIVKRAQRFEGFTVEGERILAWARRILSDWDALRQDVREMCGEPMGEIRLGAIPTAVPIASLLTTPCRARYPGITYSIVTLPANEILRQLDAFELDAGISYLEDFQQPQYFEVPLYRERYVLILGGSVNFEGRETVSWSEAGALALCLLTPKMQNRRIIDAALRQAGVQPRVAAETDSVLAIYAHVRFGGLASIIPHSLLTLFWGQPGLRAFPIEPPLSRQIGLLGLHRDPCTPLLQMFRTVAQEVDIQARIDQMIDRIT